jgi:hypothetical protein
MTTEISSDNSISNKIKSYLLKVYEEVKLSIRKISADTIEWIGILALLGATVPSLLGLMTGLTDSTPPIDVVLILWGALAMFFIKAALQKDFLNLVTIGLGFMTQAVMIALIFFK